MIVRFNFDGMDVSAQSGFTILKALSYLGIDIAHLCYYKLDNIKKFNYINKNDELLRCKLCLVKVRKRNEEGYSFRYACNEIVENGMEVISNDEEIIEYRKSLLKSILYKHRVFCDKCESDYKCKLKKYIDIYDIKIERFNGEDVNLEEVKDFISSLCLDDYIKVDYDKCINCGVCGRYEAISGYKNMIVDICPTKVFSVERKLDFKESRESDEEKTEYKKISSFCIGCNQLCECDYFCDNNRIIDIQSPELKKYGICDFGRMMKYHSNERFSYPLINGIEDDFDKAKDFFHKFIEESDKNTLLAISSSLYPVEDIEAFNDFIYSLALNNFIYKRNTMATNSNVLRDNYTNINKYSSKHYKYGLNDIGKIKMDDFDRFIILEDPLFENEEVMEFIKKNRRNYIVFSPYSSVLSYNSYLAFPIAGFGEFDGYYIDFHGKNRNINSFLDIDKNRLKFRDLIKYLYL